MENDFIRKIKEIFGGKEKEEEEFIGRKKFEEIELRPFSIHDWDKDFEIVMLEKKAEQIQREYNALKTIQECSEKIEALREQMENNSEESFEVETSTSEDLEVFDEVDISSEDSCGESEAMSSDLNLETNFDASPEFGIEMNADLSGVDAEFSGDFGNAGSLGFSGPGNSGGSGGSGGSS